MEELQSTILKLQRELQEAQEEIREKDKEIESLLQQNRALTQHIKALNEALSKSGDQVRRMYFFSMYSLLIINCKSTPLQANVTEVGTLSLATENKVLQTTLDSRTEILKDWLENAKVWVCCTLYCFCIYIFLIITIQKNSTGIHFCQNCRWIECRVRLADR